MKKFYKILFAVMMVMAFSPNLIACAAKETVELPEGGYVDVYAAAKAASVALDDLIYDQHDNYAVYYSNEEYLELIEAVAGSYSGIGVYITQDEESGLAVIASVIKGTPAMDAGFQTGDLFLKLDDIDLTNVDYEQVTSYITSNAAGTDLTIVVDRPEVGEVVIEVTTAVLNLPTVDYLMVDEVTGLIAISTFSATTDDQFDDAIEELESQGMEYLIIDLRNNGGGELTASLSICDYFVAKGEPMMYVDDAAGDYYYVATSKYLGLSTVVLVNGNSASASEVLAGAIKDSGSGYLLGEVTFGKGIVQSIFKLSSGAGLKYTTAKYKTAGGNDIHGVGIEPDEYMAWDDSLSILYQYSMDPELDPQLAYAMELVTTLDN